MRLRPWRALRLLRAFGRIAVYVSILMLTVGPIRPIRAILTILARRRDLRPRTGWRRLSHGLRAWALHITPGVRPAVLVTMPIPVWLAILE